MYLLNNATNITLLLLAVAAIISFFVVIFIRRDTRKYSLALVAERACPRCGKIYSIETANSAVLVKYQWHLAPGSDAANLKLSRENFLMTCPRCHEEFEFTMDGQLFLHPHTGIVSFTKTARPLNRTLLEPGSSIIVAPSTTH